MSTKLLIVESPAKARTIGEYLGKDYTVLASIGHVRDLPKSNKSAIDIEGGFIPHYVISPGKKEVIDRIAEAAKKASIVYLATDPDREGEAIAWHIKQAVGLKKPKRVVFHEITKTAVEEALTHPRDIDENLRQAQEARRVLDRLVGYDLSGLIWKKVRYGLSAGRVQSPALRILAEKEREIKAFIPELYYVLSGEWKHSNGSIFATADKEIGDKGEAERIVLEGNTAQWHVAKVVEREEERSPKAPFTTSTLQQAASTRLGYSPSRTMRVAQKLYEGGHISYMRTDSVTLGAEALSAVSSVVVKEFGKELHEARTYTTKSKNAQEAHEAIRPTKPAVARAGASDEERELYSLIRTRTLASQMKNARVLRTKITLAADAVIPTFSATGSRTIYEGWLLCDTGARGEDTELPLVQESDPAKLVALSSIEKATEPPNRYTEAGLVKELEKRGIGRPSTYASIIKTLQDREYVEKLARALKPTATGMVVSGFLETHFAEYISDSFTAEMEDELDDIALGKREYAPTLKAFYDPLHKAVLSKEDLPKATALGAVPPEFVCPLCGGEMEFKLGRAGIFMSCTRFPDCAGARAEDGNAMKDDEPLGIHPETGKPIFVKTGRFGPYVEMDLAEKSAEPEIVEEVLKTKSGKPKRKKKVPTPATLRRASIPAGTSIESVTLADAVKYLSLPRTLGMHPETGEPIIANVGRFGPYLGHAGEFRSLKKPEDPYTILLERAVAILKEPKKLPKGVELVREIGKHPRTGKVLSLYKSKQGYFLKKGLRRIFLPDSEKPMELSPEVAAAYLA